MTDRQTRIARLLLRVESSRQKFDREWNERADRLMARRLTRTWFARLAADYRGNAQGRHDRKAKAKGGKERARSQGVVERKEGR
jgi:hypothetical protein